MQVPQHGCREKRPLNLDLDYYHYLQNRNPARRRQNRYCRHLSHSRRFPTGWSKYLVRDRDDSVQQHCRWQQFSRNSHYCWYPKPVLPEVVLSNIGCRSDHLGCKKIRTPAQVQRTRSGSFCPLTLFASLPIKLLYLFLPKKYRTFQVK